MIKMQAQNVMLLLCILVQTFAQSDDWIRRMEYKVSLKTPEISFNDNEIPFWTSHGHVVKSPDRIRLVTGVPGQIGFIYSNKMFSAENWMFESVFRISGKGIKGGEGMAFWFTKDILQRGHAFGSSKRWNGLGIFLDTFDNDRNGNNPFVAAMVNDGTVSYNQRRDGEDQLLCGCSIDYRNKPNPTKIRVTYLNRTLSIEMNNDMSSSDQFTLCCRQENVDLPRAGHFGISASTNVLYHDDHDIFSFVVHVLVPRTIALQVDEATRKQLEEYYAKAKEIGAAQQQFAKEHPDKLQYLKPGFDVEEDPNIVMIIQLFQNTYKAIKGVDAKVNQVIGRLDSDISSICRGSESVIFGSDTGIGASNLRLTRELLNVIHNLKQVNIKLSDGAGNTNAEKITQLLATLEASIMSNKRRMGPKSYTSKLLWFIVLLQMFIVAFLMYTITCVKKQLKKFY